MFTFFGNPIDIPHGTWFPENTELPSWENTIILKMSWVGHSKLKLSQITGYLFPSNETVHRIGSNAHIFQYDFQMLSLDKLELQAQININVSNAAIEINIVLFIRCPKLLSRFTEFNICPWATTFSNQQGCEIVTYCEAVSPDMISRICICWEKKKTPEDQIYAF